jgi:hypothetical protein
MQYFWFSALSSGIWRFSQESLVHRTMPGKRVLPIIAANFRDDYAEGLGRYPTGFLRDKREEEV